MRHISPTSGLSLLGSGPYSAGVVDAQSIEALSGFLRALRSTPFPDNVSPALEALAFRPRSADLTYLLATRPNVNVTVYTTGTNTWTKPGRLLFIRVLVVGGGGSGGSVAAAIGTSAGAGGGGAAGTALKTIGASSLSATETAVVGAGGAAPATGAVTGNDGNNSTFTIGGSISLTGGLGKGGVGMAAGNTGLFVQGGRGGTASGGDYNLPGGGGRAGVRLTATVSMGGGGGGSPFAGNTADTTADGASEAASNYGGGGGGAKQDDNVARAGAAGRDGIIVIEEWKHS